MVIAEVRAEYKALYLAELARREELNKAIDRPIAIISAFIGVLYFAFAGLVAPATFLQCAEILLALIIVGLLIVASFFLVRSYYGHTYGFVPTPLDLEDYRAKLEDYHSKYVACPPEEIAGKVLDHIYSAYIQGGHQNALINDQRSGYLHNAKAMLVRVVPLIVILVILKIVSVPTFSSWISSLPRLFT